VVNFGRNIQLQFILVNKDSLILYSLIQQLWIVDFGLFSYLKSTADCIKQHT